jgi:hypothetical protein
MKTKPQRMKKAAARKRTAAKSKLLYLALLGVLVAALVSIVGFGGTGSNPAPEAIPGGSLTAADDFHDFGRLSMRDGIVSYAFRVQNTGSEPALIRKLYTS